MKRMKIQQIKKGKGRVGALDFNKSLRTRSVVVWTSDEAPRAAQPPALQPAVLAASR